MIEIKKIYSGKKVKFLLDLDIDSSKINSNEFDVIIRNLSIDGFEKEETIGILKIDSFDLQILGLGDLISITLNASEYKDAVLMEFNFKKEEIEKKRIESAKLAFRKHSKFQVEYIEGLGYFINGEGIDAFDDTFLEIEAAMNQAHEKIQKAYPEIKNKKLDISLNEIVDLLDFKSSRKAVGKVESA